MSVAEMALNYLRLANERSMFRRHVQTRHMGYHCGDDDFVYDVDTLKIKRLQVKWLPYLAYGVVDVAGRDPFLAENHRDNDDMGLCVINSPVYVFIPREKKEAFAAGLCLSVGERFLPISPLQNRLLDCGPRKCHIEHVLQALSRADIPYVNVYAYGLKSSGAYFLFIDDINRDASVEMDIGFHLRPNAGCITLVKPKPGANIPRGDFGRFPMLASVQRTSVAATFGSFRWASLGVGGGIDGRVRKVKIYSGLVHCLESFRRETSFGTLPKTGKMMRTRMSQGREFMNWVARNQNWREHVENYGLR